MASVEILELQTFPIWSPQPGEPAEKYLIFERYFLSRVKANLTQTYRDYLIDQGKDGQAESVSCPPTSWRDDCERYLWRERHQAYWLKKTWDDRAWRDQKIKEYQSSALDTVALLRLKAQEILEALDIQQTSAKDAAALIRLANEMSADALGYGDLDKSINKVFAAGLQVIEPELEQGNGHVRVI